MKTSLKVVVAVLLVLYLSGCQTGKWEQISYITPASDINFSDRGRLKLIPQNKENQLLSILVKSIESDFLRNKSVVIDDKNPNYVLIFDLQSQFRSDKPGQVKFNTKYEKSNIETKAGSHDIIKVVKHESNTNANFLTVKIYEVNTITPIDTLNFVFYDADFIPVNSKSKRNKKDFIKAFQKQVSLRIRNVMLRRKREISTYIPDNASSIAKEALRHDYNNTKQVRKRFENIVPSNFNEFVSKAKNELAEQSWFDRNFSSARSREREERLSDLYIYSILLERNDFSPENLKEQFVRLIKIMQLTQNKALIIACSNSLGRIEHKWNLLKQTDFMGGE